MNTKSIIMEKEENCFGDLGDNIKFLTFILFKYQKIKRERIGEKIFKA